MSRTLWRCILGALLFGVVAFVGMLFIDLFCFDPWPPVLVGLRRTPTLYFMLTDSSHMLFEPNSFNNQLRPYVVAHLISGNRRKLDAEQVRHEQLYLDQLYYSTLDEEQKQKLFERERLFFCQFYYGYWLKQRARPLLYYPVMASIFGAFIVLRRENLRQKSRSVVRFQNFFSGDATMLPDRSVSVSSAPTVVSNSSFRSRRL
jgi:hypothetical protein